MKFFYFILLVESITANIITDQKSGIGATYRLPAEWEPHESTLITWPLKDPDGNLEYLLHVRQDTAFLANIIAEFEPVVIFADPSQVTAAKDEVEANVQVVEMNVDEYCTRDMSPVFLYKVKNGTETVNGVIFNFNGYGNKQFHENDGQFAKNVLELFELESITAKIVAEGGGFQTDGQGTLLATKSSLVNQNRNNKTIDEIEKELKKVLGIKKIIWFDSVKGEDLTDGHIDSLVRYIRPGVVLLSRPIPESPSELSIPSDLALNVLKGSTDADGNSFEIIEIFEPDPSLITEEHPHETSYLNFYIGNGFVTVPEYGDRRSDLEAQKIIQEQFPDRKVIGVSIDAIVLGGGGIHSITCQFPAATKKTTINNNIAASVSTMLNISLLLMIATSLLSILHIFNNF